MLTLVTRELSAGSAALALGEQLLANFALTTAVLWSVVAGLATTTRLLLALLTGALAVCRRLVTPFTAGALCGGELAVLTALAGIFLKPAARTALAILQFLGTDSTWALADLLLADLAAVAVCLRLLADCAALTGVVGPQNSQGDTH